MGVCHAKVSIANRNINVIGHSFVGSLITSNKWEELSHFFTSQELPYLSRVHHSVYQVFLVTQGEIKVCVHKSNEFPLIAGFAPESVLSKTARTLSEGDAFCFFDGGQIEDITISCIASSSNVTILGLSNAQLLEFKEHPSFQQLYSFSTEKMEVMLSNSPLFKYLSPNERKIIGPLLRLVRVDGGHAIAEQGRAGSVADSGSCGVFLSGSVVELTSISNYIYPLNAESLHFGKDDGFVPPPLNRGGSVVPNVDKLEIDDTYKLPGGCIPLSPGETICSNMCLFPGIGADKTIVSMKKSVVGFLSGNAIKMISQVSKNSLETKLRSGAVLSLLLSVRKLNPILRILTNDELNALSEQSSVLVKTSGSTLFKANDEIHSFLALLQGSLRISLNSSASRKSAKSTKGSRKNDYSESADNSLYPFSIYESGRNVSEDAVTGRGAIVQLSKNGKDTFEMFPVNCLASSSLVTPMCSKYDATIHGAVTTTDPSAKHKKCTSSVILEISHRVIDTVVFQKPFQAESTNQILSGVDDVDFIHVLRHTTGYHYLQDFLISERSSEGIFFWKAVERLEILLSRFELTFPVGTWVSDGEVVSFPVFAGREMASRLKVVHEIAQTIIIQYVREGSFYQVNIPYTLRKNIEDHMQQIVERTNSAINTAEKLQDSSSEDELKLFLNTSNTNLHDYGSLFSKAKQEVYLLLKEDSFKRWRRSEGFSKFIQETISLNQKHQ